jgi:hypothetical protein
MKFFNLETLSTIIWQQIKRAILPLLAISSIIIFQIPSNSKSSFWFCCYIKQLGSVIEVTFPFAIPFQLWSGSRSRASVLIYYDIATRRSTDQEKWWKDESKPPMNVDAWQKFQTNVSDSHHYPISN